MTLHSHNAILKKEEKRNKVYNVQKTCWTEGIWRIGRVEKCVIKKERKWWRKKDKRNTEVNGLEENKQRVRRRKIIREYREKVKQSEKVTEKGIIETIGNKSKKGMDK